MDDINELYKQLIKYLEEHNNEIVIINNKIHLLKDIMNLSIDEVYTLLSVKPGMKLYKYCPFNKNTKENIINGNVHLSNPLEFDDAFDSLSDSDEYLYINNRLQFYLQLLEVEYDSNSTNDELENILFIKMGEIADTYDKFEEYLLKRNIDIISSLGLKLLYKNALYSQVNKDCSIKKALIDEYNYYSNLASNYRIACFTTNPNNLKMWSLYANDNKGICIEYTVTDKPDKYIFSVLYSHVRGDVNTCIAYENVSTEEAFMKVLINSVLRKDICWIEQNEYRYISVKGMYDNNLVKFYPITAIYMGNKILPRNYKIVANICKRLNIDCYYMQRNLMNYELFPKKVNN